MQTDLREEARWRLLALAVALVALLATAMVPSVRRDACHLAWARVQEALQAHLADATPPMPATSFGDHYYQWSLLACPTGPRSDQTPTNEPGPVPAPR
ncbi:MAG: hypothetical protein AB7Y46_02430 [Armatimonadota bacterium]